LESTEVKVFSKDSKQKLEKYVPKSLLSVVLTSFAITAAFPYSVFASPVSSEKLIDLTNEARGASGLSDLTVDSLLTQSAEAKSNDMFSKGYFEHTSPDGLNSWYWFDLVGYRYTFAGENLAADFESSEDLFAAWMASPSHRANILSPNFADVGIAVAKNDKTLLVTQHFGAKTAMVAGANQVDPQGGNMFPLLLMTLLGAGALGTAAMGAKKVLPRIVHVLKTQITLPPI
jgi:uncharacterized protein YkwD